MLLYSLSHLTTLGSCVSALLELKAKLGETQDISTSTLKLVHGANACAEVVDDVVC